MSYVKIHKPQLRAETKQAPPPTPRVEVKDIEDLVKSDSEGKKVFTFASKGGFSLGSNSARRPARGRRMRQIASLPPMIDATITFRKVYRFVAQDLSATQKTVTTGSLLLSLGAMATATTGISSLCSSFKIHKITMYPPAGGLCFVEWVESSVNPRNKDSRMGQIVPTGITIEKPLTFVPPAGSEAALWQSGSTYDATAPGSVSLFAISSTVGAVVDLDVSCTLSNVGSNYQDTGYSSLTVGAVYYPALDGRSTNDFAPVGRPNAT